MNIHNINHNPCKSQHTTHYVVLEFLLTTTATFEMTVCVLVTKTLRKNILGLINVMALYLCLFTVVYLFYQKGANIYFSQLISSVFLSLLEMGTWVAVQLTHCSIHFCRRRGNMIEESQNYRTCEFQDLAQGIYKAEF